MNILGITVGSFFAFFPHEIHQKLDIVNINAPHSVHVLFGISVLLLTIKNISIQMALIAAFIDGMFHALFTEPFETSWYFVIKVALLISIYTFIKTPWLAALAFLLLFSVYYRSLELVFGLNIGARVPDVFLFGQRICFDCTPWKSTLIWSIVHFVAALTPFILFKKQYI